MCKTNQNNQINEPEALNLAAFIRPSLTRVHPSAEEKSGKFKTRKWLLLFPLQE